MALVLDAGGRLLAAASENGQITTWRASGLTTADCAIYNQAAQKPAAAPQPIISTGPDKDPLIKSGTGVRLAVMKFESRGLSADLGASVAEMISEQLANTQGVIVAERSSIDALLKEIELQRSGLTTSDPVAAAVQIGKGVNARKVILGSVSRFGEDAYVLSARVVDVETQRVEGSRSVTCNQCKEQNLIDAVAALRPLLVK
jgi:curli biogenesis system outer membrane secretion channel CsgG